MCVYFILIQVISYILSHLIILLIRKHFGEMNTYPFVLQAKTLSLWEISVLIKVTELVTYKAGFKLRFAWFLSPCSLCTCLYFSLRITKTYIHLSFWILIWDLIISLLSGISFQTLQGKNKCLKKNAAWLPSCFWVHRKPELQIWKYRAWKQKDMIFLSAQALLLMEAKPGHWAVRVT